MARKTFISYKYSEARDLRDRIIWALGDDATFYQGETSDSPDLTDTTTENIKRHLTDMMYNTSVTIVILSPNMKESNRHFWCRGYYVDTVGKNEKKIAEYIREQLQSDIMEDQISLKEFVDPFTGKKNK